MANMRHTTLDPAHQEQGNGEQLPSQPLPQNQLKDTPYQMPQPNESRNYEDGADYEEDYYEEDGGNEREDPTILEEVDPDQEDPEVIKLRQQVLDQEARIPEQKEDTRQMQESLLALQAFIAAQGMATNPPVVPPPGTRPSAPPIRANAPENARSIPPPGQDPGHGPSNLAQEKGKAKSTDPEGKANPQRKTPPVQKTGANPGPLPKKEKVRPIPGWDHPINLQKMRP
ncbi:uncharacterized protein LOC133785748 [Humulus lupulus]|uniref:uncharacterized protein LOC133785748 n=1 Tax=Humulus lupulus TaxID=3486 RepID=UPI002B404FA8|nr:uncharacterized protein LOC133785748 [Humulus lupulus]